MQLQSKSQAVKTSQVQLARALPESLSLDDFGRQPIEDLAVRVTWLQSYLYMWVDGSIAVNTFTPDRDHHGWTRDSGVVGVVCPQMPFCTASIRGALHRLNIDIDWLTSCNVDLSVPNNACAVLD